VGDAAGDLGEGLLDGVVVLELGQVKAIAGMANDGRRPHAMLVAEVLAEHGLGWAAGVVVGVLEALVRCVGLLDELVGVEHGYPPGVAVENVVLNAMARRGGRAFSLIST
jgi:hypothetical protein